MRVVSIAQRTLLQQPAEEANRSLPSRSGVFKIGDVSSQGKNSRLCFAVVHMQSSYKQASLPSWLAIRVAVQNLSLESDLKVNRSMNLP